MNMKENMTDATATRRAVIFGAGGAGLAVALTACGGNGDTGGSVASEPTATGPVAQVADIPEGGGKIFREQKVVITQPVQGEFKAFSAVCTHKHCLVGTVANGTINCPCHGSKFDIKDGSVKEGPAETPLPEQKINVTDGTISLT
ncbi:Rieske (2Fe-2S) protein [Sphaerimonospora cavernae]|uniref:Cytochrome bc1 complex Rieske iron-sulfur subunit n=1 Tax=Sphaerimonospora cavernae TaxID=1740611 RepID=A0ABV6U5H1_9ACTN